MRDGAVEVPVDRRRRGLTRRGRRRDRGSAVGERYAAVRGQDLPPLGYRTFVAAPEAISGSVSADPNTGCIENELLRVTLDPARCGIKFDRRQADRPGVGQRPVALRAGTIFVRAIRRRPGAGFTHDYVTCPPKSGEMITPRQAQLCPRPRNIPTARRPRRDASVEIRSDAIWATALLKAAPRGIIPDATQLRVTLYAGQPWLDLEWSIAEKTPDPWPEGGWLCFPLRADEPQFRLARLGSIVDPAKDLVPGSNHELFCLNGGLTVEGADGSRTGICPIDAQLVSLERPGLWRYTRDFVARKPDVFVHAVQQPLLDELRPVDRGLVVVAGAAVALDRRIDGDVADRQLVGGPRGCLAAVSEAAPGSCRRRRPALPSRTDPRAPAAAGPSSRGPLVTAFGPTRMAKVRCCGFGTRRATAATSPFDCPVA